MPSLLCGVWRSRGWAKRPGSGVDAGKEGSTAGSTAAPPGPGWGRGVGLRTSASGGSHAVPGAAVQVAGAADDAAVHPQEDQRLGGWTSFSPQEESAVVRRAGV